MTHKRSLVQIQYGPLLDHIEPCFTAGFDFLCTRSFCGQGQALRERNPLRPARLIPRTVRRWTGGTPRRVVVDDRRRRAIATELVARGWAYVMPRPKSSQAKWGNTDARTTWWTGYWKNGDLDLVSTAQPSESDGFKGDGEQPGWRRGGSPASPSDVEWLCSESGGPASGG